MNLSTVYIVRHGIAEDYSSAGSDAARRLTEAGIEKTRAVAVGLQRTGAAPELILTSPLERARETAEILANVLGGAALRETDALRPGVDFSALMREAMKPPKPARVMFVGHQPDLGMLASWLATGDPYAVHLPFRKAGSACLEIAGDEDRMRGTLQWFLTPAQLRAIR